MFSPQKFFPGDTWTSPPELKPLLKTLLTVPDIRLVPSLDEEFSYCVYATTRTEEMALVDWSTEQKEAFLRMQMTRAEVLLWEQLRSHRLDGLKFRRQHPMASFIVDFFCPARKVIIELDGGVHEAQVDYDTARSEYLSARGYQVLRFSNDQVEKHMPVVLGEIRRVCQQREHYDLTWRREMGEKVEPE